MVEPILETFSEKAASDLNVDTDIKQNEQARSTNN